MPAIIGTTFSLIINIVNVTIVGHLGSSAQIAGYGLGNTVLNIFAMSIFFGMNGAISSMVSQASGTGNEHLCGVVLNRGRFVSTVAFIPMMIILWFSEKILLAIGQDRMAADYGAVYARLLIPGMFFLLHFDAIK